MKRSKQCTLFEFVVFAKTKKWEGTDVVVSGTCMSNVAISDEMAPALTLYRFGTIRPVIVIRTV